MIAVNPVFNPSGYLPDTMIEIYKPEYVINWSKESLLSLYRLSVYMVEMYQKHLANDPKLSHYESVEKSVSNILFIKHNYLTDGKASIKHHRSRG